MRVIAVLISFVILTYGASAQIDSLHTAGKPVAKTAAQNTSPVVIRICAPSRGQLLHSPLLVILAKDKMIYKSDTLQNGKLNDILGEIPVNDIESVTVLKDVSAIKTYGNIAKNGVVEIHLKGADYPDISRMLKTNSAGTKQ